MSTDDIAQLKNLFPLLGKQVELRLFRESDLTDIYVDWLNDPQVVKYSNQRFKTHSIQSCRTYFLSFNNNDALFIAIYLKSKNIMIGTMTVYFNINHSVADLGVLLGDKSCWGKGLGRDSWKMVLDLLLQNSSVRKVTGGTLACNIGMLNVMRATGMEVDGIRKSQEIVDGKSYDINYFAVYK